jgi:hypothetical protein
MKAVSSSPAASHSSESEVHLFVTFFVELLHHLSGFFDLLYVDDGADDVLEVFEHADVVLCLGLGLHHGDLLDLALEDEEPVVVEVDAARLEQVGDVGERARVVVDEVFGRVVLVGHSRDDQRAVWHDFVLVVGLQHGLKPAIT